MEYEKLTPEQKLELIEDILKWSKRIENENIETLGTIFINRVQLIKNDIALKKLLK